MKVFSNGCSFTWGGALYQGHDEYGRQLDWWNTGNTNQQRINKVWPSKLAKLCNAEHVNLSMGCGSNQRIVRTTLDYFSDQISGGTFSNDWIAIIQWSLAPRFEYFDELSDGWALCMPNGCNTDVQTDWSHKKYIEKFIDMYYRYTNDKTWAQNYFTQTVALASFFDKHNIPFWFSNLDKHVFDHLETWQQDYLRNNANWIGAGPWINFGSLFHDRHHEGSGHPSEQGHTEIANSIYQHIKDMI